MNTDKITGTLRRLFDETRIVFWNDTEKEFAEALDELVPESVTAIRVEDVGALAVKIRIELEEPTASFLLYSEKPTPDPEDDWLYDVRYYSRVFTADSASLLLDELGLERQSLRELIKAHKNFFANKERVEKLKRWLNPADGEPELLRKMLGVAAGADQPEFAEILLRIFTQVTRLMPSTPSPLGTEQISELAPPKWKDVEKFGLADNFWKLVEGQFGYQGGRSLYALLVALLATDFAVKARSEVKIPVAEIVIKDRTGGLNASVFISNWRTNVTALGDYKTAAAQVARELKIEEWISSIDAAALTEVETFDIVEKRLIVDLRDRLLAPLPADTSDIQSLINARRNRFWSRDSGLGYAAIFDALEAALEFYKLKLKYGQGFAFASASAAFAAYKDDLFRFDQQYRLFCEAAHKVKFEGMSILKPLAEGVEKTYGNWFLENLGNAWGKCVEHEKMFDNWSVDGVPNQYRFYRSEVGPYLKEFPDRKLFVIISDAFRYESAEELVRNLNSESRRSGAGILEAELTPMLGVVPSYTALGMASLLPWKTLEYKGANADVLYADGISTAGLDQRDKVLKTVSGAAIRAEDLLSKGKEGGREFVRDLKIVYIYHNKIDALGDSASTESETFNAVRKTIEELSQLVVFVVNSLSGSRILITADHGFLFQENPPEQIDKSSLDIKSGEVLKRKKRYVVNPTIEPQANAWNGKIAKTAAVADGMEFLIPKGTNRFHFTGGARFVHGGAMPQEICVPLITVKKLRGASAASAQVTGVGVTMLGSLNRIVNNVQRFEFIQSDKVTDRRLPRTLTFSLRDENDELISDEVTATFDCRTDSMEERRKFVTLTLRSSGAYDNKKTYNLVLREEDAVVKEYSRIPMKIDIAFMSEF